MNKQEIAEFVLHNIRFNMSVEGECQHLIELWDAAHRPQPPTPEQREDLAKQLREKCFGDYGHCSWENLQLTLKADWFRVADWIIARYGPPPASEVERLRKERDEAVESMKNAEALSNDRRHEIDELRAKMAEAENRIKELEADKKLIEQYHETTRSECVNWAKRVEELESRPALQPQITEASVEAGAKVECECRGFSWDAIGEGTQQLYRDFFRKALSVSLPHLLPGAAVAHPFDKHVVKSWNPVEANPEAQ